MDMKKLPDEFKRQALKLAAQPGMNLRLPESDLGITRGLVYKRCQRYGNPRFHAELCPASWGNPRPYSRHPTPQFCYPHVKAP